VIAGVAAGIAGLLAFLAVHHAIVRPIWFVAPAGATIAALGGLAVWSAYDRIRPRLPQRTWLRIAAVVAAVGLALAPSLLLAERRGPVFAMTGPETATLVVPVSDAAIAFGVELVGVTAVTAAAIGALAGRSRSVAAWFALAGTGLALGPGHNIPFLGGTGAVGTELTLLAASVLTAATTLVVADTAVRGPRDPARPADQSGRTFRKQSEQ
jgi:hypothetical protein